MATSDSREVVIEASPEEILDVIADVEATPEWSPQYQSWKVVPSIAKSSAVQPAPPSRMWIDSLAER